MLETNIRIVQPGTGLRLVVRRASLEGPDLSNDLLERACGTLRYRYGLAAIPTGRSGVRELLVAGNRPVPEIVVDGPGWTLSVRDSNQAEEQIHLASPEDRLAISELLERAFLAHLSKQPSLWTLDSPRKWHRREALETIDGIAAYRRFDVGTVIIDGVGVGIAVDLATAFFTEHTLDFLLGFGLREGERRKRFEYFEQLTGRQSGQKGTLVYDSGRGQSKCYFEDAPEGVTCGTTGPVRIGAEKTYPSLFEYYRSVRPQLQIAQGAPAVRVSFRGIGRPQFVAAEKLRVRVMNDDVPRPLDSIDKIDPDRRRVELEEFWQALGPRPLGHVAPGFREGFWRPDKEHEVRFAMPALRFGHGQELSEVPEWSSADKYRAHYNQRLEYLANSGCYSVPPALGRALYCAYPARLGEDAPRELADLIANKLGIWTGLTFTAELIPYTTVQEAIRELRNCELPGVVIFVLNDEPSAYYEVALQLADWRVKRITERQLARHYRQLTEPRNGGVNNGSSARRGSAAWERFVDMNSLATLELLDCVPWRTTRFGPYEAQVSIDVGYDRRYFALSLAISRADEETPAFWVDSLVVAKADHQREAINPIILSDMLLELFRRAKRRSFSAIHSLLVFRDGQFSREEIAALLQRARPTLVAEGFLGSDARLDLVDFHKKSAKCIRLWEVTERGYATNPIEGVAIILSHDAAVVCSTGAATLHQGTAQPFLLLSRGESGSVLDAAHAAFDGAQLNFASPRVAQRLPLIFERTDEELEARAAQEIRRVR